MKYRAIALILAMIPIAASAESWRAASKSKTSVEFVDSDSLRRFGNVVEFVSQIVPATPMPGDVDRVVQTKQVDCVAWTMAKLEGIYYSGSKVMLRDPAKPAKSIAANSVSDGIAKTVCGQRDYQSGPLSNPASYAADYFATVR